MKLNTNLGLLFAGIWFVLTGLISLIDFGFDGLSILMALLALAAGILLILGR